MSLGKMGREGDSDRRRERGKSEVYPKIS